MDMTAEQRADLGARITEARMKHFKGSRKAAYTVIGLNSGTWTKAEAGEPLAERTVVAILLALWPETGGDWRRMDPPLGGQSAEEAAIMASNMPADMKAQVLATYRAARRDLTEERSAQ